MGSGYRDKKETRKGRAKIDSLFSALLGCPRLLSIQILVQLSNASLSLKFSSMHVEWCEEYEQRLAVANDIREVSDES